MEEKVIELVKFVAEKLDLETDTSDIQKLLFQIKESDERIFTLISSFNLAFDAWIFARKDMQLNLKAPDLFYAQKKVFKENLNTKANELYIECLKSDIVIKDFLKDLEIEY